MTMITSVRFWNLMALIESNSIFSGSWYFLESGWKADRIFGRDTTRTYRME